MTDPEQQQNAEIVGMEHCLPDIPVVVVVGVFPTGLRWASSCKCGYGVTSDSPEAAVLAMALHLYETLPDDAPEREFYDIRRREQPDSDAHGVDQ